MQYKIENNTLIAAPINFRTPDGIWICNFCLDIAAMNKYGYTITEAAAEEWRKEHRVPQLTREAITEKIYQAKAKTAYGGLTVNRSGIDYTFSTDAASIALCNAVLFSIGTGIQSVDWKVWRDREPEILTLNASEFRAIFTAGMTMIQAAFAIEAELNEEYANKTDAEISVLTEAEVDENISAHFDTLHPIMEI